MYICKKKPKNGGEFVFIWIDDDRNRNEIVDFEVGDRSQDTYKKMEDRIKNKYSVKKLCTDKYSVYKKQKLAKEHYETKAETSLVESKNSLIRHYLARFNRKTKRYSKSIEMITATLILFFNKNLLNLDFYL
jgi:insertion element IS1 protein InsB